MSVFYPNKLYYSDDLNLDLIKDFFIFNGCETVNLESENALVVSSFCEVESKILIYLNTEESILCVVTSNDIGEISGLSETDLKRIVNEVNKNIHFGTYVYQETQGVLLFNHFFMLNGGLTLEQVLSCVEVLISHLDSEESWLISAYEKIMNNC